MSAVYVTVGSKKKDCHSNTALLFHTQTSDRGCRLLKSGDEVVKGVKRPQAPIEVQYVTASKLDAPFQMFVIMFINSARVLFD